MTESWSGLRRLRPYGWWLFAVAGGALASVLVLLLFYRLGGLSVVAPPVVLDGELQVVVGQGQPTPAGLEIRQPGPQGVAVVQAPVQRMVRAALYRHLSWRVRGLEPDRRLHLAWVTLAEPQKSQELTLPPAGPDGVGELDLRVNRTGKAGSPPLV